VPFKYLGVTTGIRRLVCSSFEPLLQKIHSKFATRKVMTLSFVVKATLIQSLLQSIPIYLLSSAWVLKGILYKIDVLCKKILWSKNEESKRLSLVAWDTMCLKK